MASEQYGFVVAVSFIILFSVLLATVPADFQGPEETPDMITPLDPSIITGFSDSVDYEKANFTINGLLYYYAYPAVFAGREWVMFHAGSEFFLGAKIIYGGILWLGQYEFVKFTSSAGANRGDHLSFAEMNADATDGVIRYELQYVDAGTSAGGFVVYWNSSVYADSEDAWTLGNSALHETLYLLHGVGIQETANTNIGSLLISLLFLQIPEVPLLVNILLVTPLWASIIFVLWYVIKEMIPFV